MRQVLSSASHESGRMHPIWGIELLAAVEFPWDIKPIIRWHHERHDGSGYPDRLRGDEIPVSAQIVGIADVYDALTTRRPYRPALPVQRALAEMDRCRGWWSGGCPFGVPEVVGCRARAGIDDSRQAVALGHRAIRLGCIFGP